MSRLALAAAGRKKPVDPTGPSPFGPPLQDLVDREVGKDRGWHVGNGRRNPNTPMFTPLRRKT